MNSLVTLIGLRAAALGLALSGQQKLASSLYVLADALEAGRASEEHLRLVAEKLNAREINDADWDEVLQRIETDSARLQAVSTAEQGGGEPAP